MAPETPDVLSALPPAASAELPGGHDRADVKDEPPMYITTWVADSPSAREDLSPAGPEAISPHPAGHRCTGPTPSLTLKSTGTKKGARDKSDAGSSVLIATASSVSVLQAAIHMSTSGPAAAPLRILLSTLSATGSSVRHILYLILVQPPDFLMKDYIYDVM